MIQREAQEQRALFRWAALHTSKYPGLEMLFAIPNGGRRDARTAALLKAEGMRAGVPDICLPVARHGYGALWIELKCVGAHGKRAGVASRAQNDWGIALAAHGQLFALCHGWDKARGIIIDYLAP